MQVFSDLSILTDIIIQQLSPDPRNLNSFNMQTLLSLKGYEYANDIHIEHKIISSADSIRDKQRWPAICGMVVRL